MMIDTVRNWFGLGPSDVQTSAHTGERSEPTFVQTSVQDSATSTVIRSSDPQVIDLLGGPKSASGFAVTETSSMRVSTVYACVRLIASTIADMPVNVYERMVGYSQEIASDIWYLLNEQPHALWTAAAMWEWILKSMLLRGDGYCEIQRNRRGEVIGLLPLHPDRVCVDLVDGRLRYSIYPEEGKPYGRDQDDMLHFPGFGFDGRNGMSVIQYAAFQSIGIALAAESFSGKFFANGATPKHLIKASHKMEEEQIDLLRRTYEEKYSGVENAGKPLVLTQGLDIKELSLSSADVELLASRKYQVIDICRAFGVPPVMVGAQETTSSWGSGIEQLVLGFVKFTCLPHMTRMKQELNRKLYRTSGKIFVAHDYDALLAGDTKSEADYMRQAVGGSQGPGWMTLNEARRKKNLPPVAGGDVLYYPKNGKANDEQTPPAAAAR